MLYPQLVLMRNRRNVIPVNLGVAVVDGDLRAQIRTGPSETSELVATWDITIVDAAQGIVTLELPSDWAVGARHLVYTDLIRVSDDLTLMPVLECSVIDGVTA